LRATTLLFGAGPVSAQGMEEYGERYGVFAIPSSTANLSFSNCGTRSSSRWVWLGSETGSAACDKSQRANRRTPSR